MLCELVSIKLSKKIIIIIIFTIFIDYNLLVPLAEADWRGEGGVEGVATPF